MLNLRNTHSDSTIKPVIKLLIIHMNERAACDVLHVLNHILELFEPLKNYFMNLSILQWY